MLSSPNRSHDPCGRTLHTSGTDDTIRRRLRRQSRRLDRLAAAMPGGPEERLADYRADPARLMADAGYQPDDWQRDLLRSASPRVLMLTCRQVGKSTTAGFLALREALAAPGNTVLVVCPSQRQNAELVRGVTEAVNRLGRPMGLVGESALQLRFANRSRVIALPASESGIRCYTAAMVVLDEAARLPEPIVAAVRPMLAVSGGKLVALSTAFAKSGFFYDQWSGPEPWNRVRVTAEMCPRIPRQFLDEERRTLGRRWYAMEYECEFGDDVAAVFRWEDIERARRDDVEPLFPVGEGGW